MRFLFINQDNFFFLLITSKICKLYVHKLRFALGNFVRYCKTKVLAFLYLQTNLNCVGSHAGVSIGEDGPSQMALEDIAMFRSIPTATVFYPSDAVSTERACELAANTPGICFIRTSRPATTVVYDNDHKFEVSATQTKISLTEVVTIIRLERLEIKIIIQVLTSDWKGQCNPVIGVWQSADYWCCHNHARGNDCSRWAGETRHQCAFDGPVHYQTHWQGCHHLQCQGMWRPHHCGGGPLPWRSVGSVGVGIRGNIHLEGLLCSNRWLYWINWSSWEMNLCLVVSVLYLINHVEWNWHFV